MTIPTGSFLAAQSDAPHDPTSMLIQADWFEERGDLASALALRGLAEAGFASLVTLAIGVDLAWPLDETGIPLRAGEDGLGHGQTDGNWVRAERGCGFGEADRHAGGTETSMLEGYGHGAADERRPEWEPPHDYRPPERTAIEFDERDGTFEFDATHLPQGILNAARDGRLSASISMPVTHQMFDGMLEINRVIESEFVRSLLGGSGVPSPLSDRRNHGRNRGSLSQALDEVIRRGKPSVRRSAKGNDG